MSQSLRKSPFRNFLFLAAAISLAAAALMLVRPSAALTNNGSINAFEVPLTENFDSLANTGTGITWTDNTTIPGWYSTRTTYNTGTGSSNTGALYSFGVAGVNAVTDRALGSVASGSTSTIFYAVRLRNNTGAAITSLDVSYVGEQWRNGGNTNAQTLTFQYQVANSGVITGANNPTSGWTTVSGLSFTSPITGASAATLDGNAAANRTSKSGNLAISIAAGQEVWLRWQDIDDSGNDHGLAIDDFSVTAHGAGPTNPTGVGASSPSSVFADGTTTTRLTVTVTPGTSPISTGLAVSANLTPIGGIANQTFYDDGTHGDQTAGDNIFSFSTTVANGTSGGNKSLNATVSDAQSRSSATTIPLTVLAPTPPTGAGSANPTSVFPGDATALTVNVTPGTNPTSTGLTVTADLSSIGGSATQAFSPSGNTFTFNATVSNATAPGTKNLPFTVSDSQGRSTNNSIPLTVKTPVPPNDVVISQVYGGGGNTGSTFKNDYIELHNRSSAPVSLSGWSVQAFQPQTADWAMTPLPNFTLQPGQYFLIQESQGAGGTDNLPTPDAAGNIAVSSTSTKVFLVNNTTLLTTCPEADPGAYGVVDGVGYGGTDCWEGSGTASTLDNLTALFRRDDGCFDTNDNAADFVTGDPSPRNSVSPTHDCTGLFGYGSANPTSVAVGSSVALTVHVLGAQNPASTGLLVTADLSAIGGSPSQTFGGGGNVFTFNQTVPTSNSGGFKSLPVTITDAQSRSFNTSIVLSVLPLVPDHVTISQIYGGGGNSGATYRNDYVELYNPTGSPVSVTGWSIQYASATGSSWTNKQPIGGTIGPGEYLLVGLASGGANGSLLPPSQIVNGSINMSATTGKVALVRNSDTLTGICPLGTDPDIVDFVGYGASANCFEGSTHTPAPNNTTAIFRKLNGGQDTDQNGNDFVTGTPNPRQTAPIVELGPWVANTDPNTNGTNVPHDASVTVGFSEPVNVDPGWYNINCASTGLHNDATVAHTSDLTTYAITPNTNFQFSEQCTVTIFKTAIHDTDTNDSAPDTDGLVSDYTWSFTVVAAGQPAPYPPSVHLTMGNPSNAVADTSQPNNYLMEKPTYALSYNRDKGTPNWVSWHLEPAWYGTLARVDVFRPDPAVPPDWYRVQAFDYAGTGFDRGHMTPNADRDNQNRIPINQETYLMSNMVPQAPGNNQGPWAALEAALRSIADGGNELYIISGPLGVGGTGSNGGTTNSVANGNVTVPAYTWKVALVLPLASGDDTSRVTCSTRTIAVLMPNQDSIRSDPWQNYLTTVDNIEQQTGYDFFSNLPTGIQRCVQAGVNGVNPPGTADQSASTPEDTPVTLTLRGFQANNNQLTFSITGGPTSGALGTIGATSCANGICTANVTYSPNADVNGSDSFTFKVNDGTNDSAASTFTVGITEVNDPPSAVDDAKGTSEDTPLTFAASDLTVTDSAGPANESGQALTVTAVNANASTHGTVGLASGSITYSPDANYNGAASFTYTVCDNGTTNGSPDSRCTTATVNVTVDPVNDAPKADSQSVSTNEDSSVSIALSGNDVETPPGALQFTVTQGPSHGTLSGAAPNLTYSPNGNYNGPDTIKFTVTDTGDGSSAALTSSEATVTITVNPVNDAPIANSQSVATNANTPLSITLTGSDVETPPGALTFAVASGPAHGWLSGSGANRTYTPFSNYSGPDSFTFTVTDTGDGSSPALTSSQGTVSIFVNDTVPPTITLNDNSIALWPLDKSLHTISVADLVAGAGDNYDPNVTLNSVVIARVSSDEGTAASGDIVIAADCKAVQLRATRNGNGDGRVYTITFRVRDAAGNVGYATAQVTVPHDQGNGSPAIDSGVAYTVNSTCP